MKKLKITEPKKRKGASDVELLGEAQRLYAKYIINGSPFQVNLPDHIIRSLEASLKDLFARAAQMGYSHPSLQLNKRKEKVREEEVDLTKSSSATTGQVMSVREPPTLFDRAQENIFRLMNTDSFPRYQRSEEYKILLEEVNKREQKSQY